MKLSEAIERLDRSDQNKCWIAEDFAAELGLESLFPYLDYEEHGFASYFLTSWLCTDTHVGTSIVFYAGEPIAVVHQESRRGGKAYAWIGGYETKLKMRGVLLSLYQAQDGETFVADLNEDIGEGFAVTYSGELLDKTVLLKETGEPVEVVKTYRSFDQVDRWRHIDIRPTGGKKQTVTMAEILVPYRVKSLSPHP